MEGFDSKLENARYKLVRGYRPIQRISRLCPQHGGPRASSSTLPAPEPLCASSPTPAGTRRGTAVGSASNCLGIAVCRSRRRMESGLIDANAITPGRAPHGRAHLRHAAALDGNLSRHERGHSIRVCPPPDVRELALQQCRPSIDARTIKDFRGQQGLGRPRQPDRPPVAAARTEATAPAHPSSRSQWVLDQVRPPSKRTACAGVSQQSYPLAR
jgi:hypothetical protein